MPLSGGRTRITKNTLDLRSLTSAPIDTIHVQNPTAICECMLFFQGLRLDLEPEICSIDLIKTPWVSCGGPPWERYTSEANLAEGCRSPLDMSRLVGTQDWRKAHSRARKKSITDVHSSEEWKQKVNDPTDITRGTVPRQLQHIS